MPNVFFSAIVPGDTDNKKTNPFLGFEISFDFFPDDPDLSVVTIVQNERIAIRMNGLQAKRLYDVLGLGFDRE